MRGRRRSNVPVCDGLPRPLYAAIVGPAVWLVVSGWGFAGKGYTGLALTIVSLFIGVAVGLPSLLGLIARRHRAHADDAAPGSLREWLGCGFASHTGEIGGKAAAIQVLLPLAAAAFGMTLLALVHHFDIGA